MRPPALVDVSRSEDSPPRTLRSRRPLGGSWLSNTARSKSAFVAFVSLVFFVVPSSSAELGKSEVGGRKSELSAGHGSAEERALLIPVGGGQNARAPCSSATACSRAVRRCKRSLRSVPCTQRILSSAQVFISAAITGATLRPFPLTQWSMLRRIQWRIQRCSAGRSSRSSGSTSGVACWNIGSVTPKFRTGFHCVSPGLALFGLSPSPTRDGPQVPAELQLGLEMKRPLASRSTVICSGAGAGSAR
jgi:hypothetical protein